VSDLRKAAEMALKALEAHQPVNYCMNNNGEKFPIFSDDPFKEDRDTYAINALRQALAQPRREWVGLTPEDIPNDPDPRFDTDEFLLGMKLAEAMLKDKNT
jgi:hypothetical protein